MNEAFLISYLAKKNNMESKINLPANDAIRALMNISLPIDFSKEFYQKQDEYLQDILSRKKIVDVSLLSFANQISLYQGDITLLKADAIVNACNERMLGCFTPLHSCIDNTIHSFAGLQVRRDLMEIMAKQGHDEENGKVKVTFGYNLPSSYIFHTVGPKCFSSVSRKDREDLASCYLSCLHKADEMRLENIVFCSISTGVYGFPIKKASRIAVDTTKQYLKENHSSLKVVFDVFSKEDKKVYESILFD